jgi:hypothetical protein
MHEQSNAEQRDGFIVQTFEGEEVHFVPCKYDGRMRAMVLSGLLANMRADCCAVDTRDGGSV